MGTSTAIRINNCMLPCVVYSSIKRRTRIHTTGLRAPWHGKHVRVHICAHDPARVTLRTFIMYDAFQYTRGSAVRTAHKKKRARVLRVHEMCPNRPRCKKATTNVLCCYCGEYPATQCCYGHTRRTRGVQRGVGMGVVMECVCGGGWLGVRCA